MFNLIFKSLQCVPVALRKNLISFQFFLLFSSIVEFFGVISIGPFVSLAANPEYVERNKFLFKLFEFTGKPSSEIFLFYVGFILALLLIISNGTLLITQIKLIKFSNMLKTYLSVELFEYYLTRGFLFHLDNGVSSLANKINSNVDRFSTGVVLAFLQINARLLSIVILLFLMFFVNAFAALMIGFSLVLIYFLVFYLVSARLKYIGKQTVAFNRDRNRIVYEALDAVRDVEFYHLHEKYVKDFKEILNRNIRLLVDQKKLKDLPYFTIETSAFVFILMVVGVSFGNSDSLNATLGELSIICLAGYKLIPKFQQVYRAVAVIKTNHSILDEMYDDILVSQKKKTESFYPVKDKTFCDNEGVFEVKNIRFSYDKNQVILDDVFFYISPGEVVGLTGISGSGKSTLMSLMLGMLTPDRGIVVYDGKIITKDNVVAWRELVGFVGSSTYVFEGDLLYNITLNARTFDRLKLDEVVKLSCFEEVVGELEDGLCTKVGTKGSKLSSGQLQRLGFARALYRQPKILFLDEATNALDFASQQKIIKKIKGKNINMSFVIISHRLDIITNFDRCYSLCGNRLKENKI